MSNLDPITGFAIPEERDNSGLDRMAAGMALANPISGWADRRFAPDYKPDLEEVEDPTYDPWADKRIEQYDPMHFVDSMSEEETSNLIADIERNKTTQERAVGPMGIAGTVAGVFTNPLIMLPAIASSGSSIPMMIAAESGGELLSEMILHSQQPLRTKTESALNIVVAAGAAGTFGLVQRKLAGRSVAREATDTAHGGDGMYAYPIPEEATVTVPVDRADMSEDGMRIEEPKNVDIVLNNEGMIDSGKVMEGLPPVADGFTRIYRAEDGKYNFHDVWDAKSDYAKELAGKGAEKLKGKYWTDSLEAADYYRETYGKGTKIKYVDVPDDILKTKELNKGEYKIDLEENFPSLKIREEILPNLEKEVAQADDAVAKATARVEAARAKLKESGCK